MSSLGLICHGCYAPLSYRPKHSISRGVVYSTFKETHLRYLSRRTTPSFFSVSYTMSIIVTHKDTYHEARQAAYSLETSHCALGPQGCSCGAISNHTVFHKQMRVAAETRDRMARTRSRDRRNFDDQSFAGYWPRHLPLSTSCWLMQYRWLLAPHQCFLF